jgi:hypothetical protein
VLSKVVTQSDGLLDPMWIGVAAYDQPFGGETYIKVKHKQETLSRDASGLFGSMSFRLNH